MDATFPFGFAWPTAFYLTLYVLTLVVHVVCMNYVLAGAAYLTVQRWRLDHRADDDPAVRLLSDWLPLMLSVAITAGIAPLLFLQILYRPQFYTANLLLFHRWLAILPVLIVGFYLLYLIRSPITLSRWPLVRRVVTTIVFLCFGFIGWSWTENHLLSLQPQQVWTEEFARRGLVFWTPELPPRLATWFVGSFPALTVWLLWQLRWTQRGIKDAAAERRLAWLAITTLCAAVACAVTYYWALGHADRNVLWSRLAAPWMAAALLGSVLQLASYARIAINSSASSQSLLLATLGVFLATLGVAVGRESLRLTRVDLASLLLHHADAYRIGGFGVFVVFLVVNTLLIAACIRLARRYREVGPEMVSAQDRLNQPQAG